MQWSVVQPSVLRRSRGLGELGLATAGMATSNFLMLGIAALIPLIRHDIPLSGPEIGAVAATPWLSAAVCSFPASQVTDRLGAGLAVGIAHVFVVAAAIVVSLAPNVAVFFCGLALLGIGYSIVNPATNVLSTGVIPARRRGLAMSVKQTGVTVGGALAGFTLPGVATVAGWRGALLIPAVAGALVAAWGFATRARGVREPLVLTDRTITINRARLGFYGLAMAGVQVAIFGYATVYLVDEVDLSPQLAGVGFALALVAGSVGRITWGIVSDRMRDRVDVLRAASVGSTAILLLLPFLPRVLVWPAFVLIGLFSVGWNGAFHAVVAESAGLRGVGRATSFALFFLYFGNVAVPPLLGLVVEHASWNWFWWIGGAGAAAAALSLQGATRKGAIVT